MNKTKNSRANILPGVIILAAGIFITAGVQLIFHACIHEDGSIAGCHAAQNVIFASGILLSLQAVLLICCGTGRSAAAVSACIFFTGIFTALIPDTVIKLCMMPSMQCLASMKPVTILMSIAVCIISLVSIVINIRKE